MMQSMAEARPADVGTPRDYSEDMYRFHLELADCGDATRHLVEEFLPQHHAIRIATLEYGFELEMPIQCAPDLVRYLTSKRVAIYQLVRLGRTNSYWREQSA